jgi:tetratricopeptide (TPR) repeat protein
MSASPRIAAALALFAVLAGCSTLDIYERPPQPPSESTPTPEPAPPGGVTPPARPPSETAGATQALLKQSRAARADGHYDQASATIERALRIAPNDPALWLELGEVELASGDPQQAAMLARKALSLAPDDRALTAQAERLLRAAGAR